MTGTGPSTTRGTRPRWRFTALAVLGLVLPACQSTPEIDRAFALSSADLVVNEHDPIPVNLAFVASPQDPIWDDLDGVDLIDPDGQVLTALTPDQFTVRVGDENQGIQLGNLAFDLPATVPDLHFTKIAIHFPDSDQSTHTPVGDWTLNRRDAAPVVQMHGTYDIAVPECGTSTATFEPDTALTGVDVLDLTTDAPGAAVTDWTVTPGTGNRFEVTFTLACDPDAFDFYTISPRVLLTHDTGETTETLDPITVGLITIDDTDIQRIANR